MTDEINISSVSLEGNQEGSTSAGSNPEPTHPSLSLEERYNIVRSIGEECIQEEELMKLLANKPEPICYDGFEPSGRMHIAQGVVKAINVNKLTDCGCRVKIWIAIGLCCQIMGRSDQDELTAAQILYPCMQCADVFLLKADICQLERTSLSSCHTTCYLQQGQEKMSKSDPSSSIYMEDEETEVNVKIKKAYCPPKIVAGNPCLEYIKYIIFPWFRQFEVQRQEQNGGNKTYESMEELIADYENEELHPADLKPALSKALNKILKPVRDHFTNDPNAKALLKRVKSYRVTK
ncbi:hypothetical protein MKX01_035204 [Papaver californicum]|nr:hypothetical protein MKX01_035204 [Papaver californicum]